VVKVVADTWLRSVGSIRSDALQHDHHAGDDLPLVDSEDGRGLFLVKALSEDVSILSTSAGTVVRCVMPVRLSALDSSSQRHLHGT